jgi:hypothetical protein
MALDTMSETQTYIEFYCASPKEMREFSSSLLAKLKATGWEKMELECRDNGGEVEITVLFEGDMSDIELFEKYTTDCEKLARSFFIEYCREKAIYKGVRRSNRLANASRRQLGKARSRF